MRKSHFSCISIAAIISLILATGCNSGNKGTPTLIDNVEVTGNQGGIESFNQIYHLYPSPAEMLSVIDVEVASFDAKLLNPVENVDKYLDTRSQTYMLGAYMTDLAYAALFGRHEATLDYLQVVRSLSEAIRIDKAVDDDMIENAKKNVEYLDSLYTISNDAFMNILAFCDRNDRSNTVVMLSAGAFAESLYLAVHLIDSYEEADHLLQHLADQKYTIDNFMIFAQNVEQNDPSVSATINDLRAIKAIYDNINPGSGQVSVATEESADDQQPKKLVIGGGGGQSQPSLTLDEFESLKAAVIELRTKITEG